MTDTTLFDLDGTLVDSGPPITAAVNAAFAAHDLPPLPFEDVRPVIGSPLHGDLGRPPHRPRS